MFHSILENLSNGIAEMLYEISEGWFYERVCTKEFIIVGFMIGLIYLLLKASKQIKDKQILLAENIRKSTEKSISWHMPQSQICHRLM